MTSLVLQPQQLMIIDDEDSDGSGIGSNRKNNQNTFSWSSTSSSNSTLLSHHTTNITEEGEGAITHLYSNLINEFEYLNEDSRELTISKIICRSASHGDLVTIKHIVTDERLSQYINLDATDDDTDGSTPLIYSSCFGKINVVKYLLEIGAKVNIQDKIGWTALMWATTNGHSDIVQLLLEYSASSETKSLSGRTIYDLVDIENDTLVSILSPTTPKQFLWRRKSAILPSSASIKSSNSNIQEEDTEEESITKDVQLCEASFRSVHKFSWDSCLPDQMFVFAQEEIDHILNIAISQLKLPMKSRSEIYVPANIIFLSARFAHYYTNRELVHELISKAVSRITKVVKSNTTDIHTLSFWIANLSQLLYYLKKDVGLVVATAEYQLEISELISETYTYLVQDSEKRMNRILEPAMIEYEQISIEIIEFADDWHRFFRRNRNSNNNNRNSIPQQQQQQQQQQQENISISSNLSPQSITSLLTSILYVLQSYDVHPVIVIQAMAQLFHFLSCEIFNRILCNKKYLCRSKALQIRMNITMIEEWVREHHLPFTLSAYFNPVIQLVQLLQCVSQLQDLMDFINTTKSFDLLNPIQVKRIILNYRYEVSEQKLPEEIEKYTMQIAEDTLKSLQLEQDIHRKLSIESCKSTNNNSRPNSISSLGSLLQSISNKKINNVNPRHSIQSVDTMINDDNENENEHYMIKEKRDSKYMLPFSLPTTTNMIHSGWNQPNNNNMSKNEPTLTSSSLSDTIYHELKSKLSAQREKSARERSIIPTIPEEWLERLDKQSLT